jgi:hypothetical protein
MGSKWNIYCKHETKDVEMVLEESPTEVQLAKYTIKDLKKTKEVLSSFDKGRIPELVEWLNSLGMQGQLGV